MSPDWPPEKRAYQLRIAAAKRVSQIQEASGTQYIKGTCCVYRLVLHGDSNKHEFLIGHDNENEPNKDYTTSERLVFHLHPSGTRITQLYLRERHNGVHKESYYSSEVIILGDNSSLPGKLGGILSDGTPYLKNVAAIVNDAYRVSQTFTYERNIQTGSITVYDTAASIPIVFNKFREDNGSNTLVSGVALTTSLPIIQLPPSLLGSG